MLGVNLGKLGFLADLTPEEFAAFFPRSSPATIALPSTSCSNASWRRQGSRNLLGLNEVVIHAGPPFHMIDLDLEVDGETVSRSAATG